MQTFLGAKISDNISKTPEGFLVCKDVPVARTGWQEYKGKELNDAETKQFQDYQTVKVYRYAEQVFDPVAMASFEGKTVTDTHSCEWVSAENIDQHHCGHVQHIRPGGTNGDGDQIMMADLFVTDPELIKKIESGSMREVSCGYRYDLHLRDDGNWEQVNIRGNHVAVVPKGRAGRQITIRDAEPQKENTMTDFLKKLFGSAETEDDYQRAARFALDSADDDDKPDYDKDKKKKAEDKKMEDAKMKDKKSMDDEDDKDKIIAELRAEMAEMKKKMGEDAKKMKDGKDADKKKDDDEIATDEELVGTVVLEEKDRIHDLMKAVGADAEYQALVKLRPAIAKSGSRVAIDAFNAQLTEAKAAKTGTKKIATDSVYAELFKAAGQKSQSALDSEAAERKTANDAVAKLQAEYDERRAKAKA